MRGGQRGIPLRLLLNKTRRRDWTTWQISWPLRQGYDRTPRTVGNAQKEAWLSRLSPGDRVLVIPKAQFQAWVSYIRRAEVTINSTCLREVAFKAIHPSSGQQHLALGFTA